MPDPIKKAPAAEYVYVVEQIKRDLKTLPPNELKFFISTLVGSIQLEPYTNNNKSLLNEVKKVLQALQGFEKAAKVTKAPLTAAEQTELDSNSKKLFSALNALIERSKLHTWTRNMKRVLIAICSTVLATILGILIGLIGFTIGFISLFTGNFRGPYFGLVMGLGIGIHMGVRLPRKAFMNDFEARLEFCIGSIEREAKGQLADKKCYEFYAEEAKEHIKKTFFKDMTSEAQEDALKTFMTTPHKFLVATSSAGFVSPRLRGHLGQHSLIRYTYMVNGKEIVDTMEFNPGKKPPKMSELNQYEPEREVSGETFFNMLVMDRILKQRHPVSLGHMLTVFSSGDDDCKAHIVKILTATDQAPTKILRFNPVVEKAVSTKIIGPIINFFAATNGQELDYLDDGVDRPLTSQKYVKLTKEQKAALAKEEAETEEVPNITAPAA